MGKLRKRAKEDSNAGRDRMNRADANLVARGVTRKKDPYLDRGYVISQMVHGEGHERHGRRVQALPPASSNRLKGQAGTQSGDSLVDTVMSARKRKKKK